MTSYIPRVLFKTTAFIPTPTPQELINADGMLFWNVWTPEFSGDPRATIISFNTPEEAWAAKRAPMKDMKKFLEEVQSTSPDLGDWFRRATASLANVRKLLALHDTHVVRHPVLPKKWALVLEY